MSWVPVAPSILLVILGVSRIHGQISTHPVVIGRLGSSAALTCHSNRVPLRLCLWEKKESDILVATFESNYLDPGASNEGYTFYGEGLDKGSCGIKIAIVNMSDLQRWKCTLLARDNSTAVYRGTVLLQGAETLTPDPSDISIDAGGNSGNFGSTSIKKGTQSESRNLGGRPIITAEGSISSAPASTQQNLAPPIQEVEVQSAGLFIVPRRKDRKLVIL